MLLICDVPIFIIFMEVYLDLFFSLKFFTAYFLLWANSAISTHIGKIEKIRQIITSDSG